MKEKYKKFIKDLQVVLKNYNATIFAYDNNIEIKFDCDDSIDIGLWIDGKTYDIE